MIINSNSVADHNQKRESRHRKKLDHLSAVLTEEGHAVQPLLKKIQDFQVAIPSWALGTGGTRFGRFAGGGEPRRLEEKMEDVGLLHALNRSSGAISLHIPWDLPTDPIRVRFLANSFGLRFDAVNSNTFQDQADQALSYKFGSLSHTDARVRQQAVDHHAEVIRHGVELGAKSLTVWLADGSCFPGQQHFRRAFERTLESLREVYQRLPADWRMFVEYKPYEPNFYSTVVSDWGS